MTMAQVDRFASMSESERGLAFTNIALIAMRRWTVGRLRGA